MTFGNEKWFEVPVNTTIVINTHKSVQIGDNVKVLACLLQALKGNYNDCR